MRNILCLLKAWFESINSFEYTYEQLKHIYYLDEQRYVRIPYHDVETIVSCYYGEQEYNEQLTDMLNERDDYIRLLRKENQELRGAQNGD